MLAGAAPPSSSQPAFGGRGELWLTHAGPGQRGVWMSPIDGL